MTETAPSYARRQALRKADIGNGVKISNGTSIDRYYEISQQLLDRFLHALDQKQLDSAYVYGIRFSTLCLEEIPKHKDYSTSRNGKLARKRKEMSEKVESVLSLLEIVNQRMDAEELLKQQQKLEAEKQRKREELEARERQMLQKQQQEKREQEAEQRKRKLKLEQKNDLEKSALAKLLAMQKTMSTSKMPSQTIKVKEEKMVKPIEQELSSTSTVVRNDSKQEKPSIVTVKQSHKTLSLDTNNNHQETDGMEVVPSPTIVKTPRRLKEEKTIQLLQEAIDAQERRLEEIDQVLIPKLLRKAKMELAAANSVSNDDDDKQKNKKKNPHRKAALSCVAQKRKLERQSEGIKGAIFTMETQMFLLQNAMEDRQVVKAMEEANQAMENLKESTGIEDLSHLDEVLTSTVSVPQSIPEQIVVEDDQDLLDELQDWLDLPGNENQQTSKITQVSNDEISILSLPQVPPTSQLQPATRKSSRVKKLLKAVL